MYAVLFHAHQKIDRVASRLLSRLVDQSTFFPDAEQIIHYEGKRGPDATRLKKNSDIDQPWHFIDPFDKDDTDLEHVIEGHYQRLVQHLTKKDAEQAAFEAAWLAHALVDGLTPPHHYPYEQKLAELHGNDRDARQKISEKFFVHGDSKYDTLRRSLLVIGPGGLLTTHTMFEAGAFMIIRPLHLNSAMPDQDDIDEFNRLGLTAYFRRQALAVGKMRLFERFLRTGWTPRLARKVRRRMAPLMVRIVVLAWRAAIIEAEQAGKSEGKNARHQR